MFCRRLIIQQMIQHRKEDEKEKKSIAICLFFSLVDSDTQKTIIFLSTRYYYRLVLCINVLIAEKKKITSFVLYDYLFLHRCCVLCFIINIFEKNISLEYKTLSD